MSWAVAGTCAVLGAAAGAAVPRAAYRLSVPWGTPPRSVCVHCGAPFSPGRAGWVRPGRACGCRDRPGATPWVTAPAVGAAAAALGVIHPVPAVAVPLAVLAVLLATIDLSCLRLPDPLVLALALLVVVPLAVVGDSGTVSRAALGAGLCAAAYLLMFVLPGAGLGFGDVKLAAILGFALGFAGWPAVVLGLLLPHVINGPVVVVLLVVRRAGRRTALPLGPALLAGALVALLVRAA